MIAHIFPGQGSQQVGMGKDLYENHDIAKELFITANKVLGFDITDVMFNGTEAQLKETRITQPAMFLMGVITARVMGDKFKPKMVAGHSLGEFSAVVAINATDFETGLGLVQVRANAMQKACEFRPSSMAAILGMKDADVIAILKEIDGIVVPANYNSPGQLVISGEVAAIDEAIEKLKEAGAKRAIKLPVRGAFHSPMMEPARIALEDAVDSAEFNRPDAVIYQNVNARPEDNPLVIKANLKAQLTGPVRWTQSIERMAKDGATNFVEVGPGKVLQGLVKKINRELEVSSAEI